MRSLLKRAKHMAPKAVVGLTLVGLSLTSVAVSANAGSNSSTRTAVVGSSQNLNNRATDVGPRDLNTSYYYKRGVVHFNAQDYDKAYRSFRRVLREKPRDANANFYMARVHALRGDHKRAIVHYNKSLRHYEGAPVLLAGLGTSLVEVNKREEARLVLDKLELASKACDNVCPDAPRIATSLHVVAMALYPAK